MKPKEPFVIKNFFQKAELGRLQAYLESLKTNPIMKEDIKSFSRLYCVNDPLTQKLHQTHAWDVASTVFPVPLKPSYSFVSLYRPGQGSCPIHVDRPQCFYTIDVCINQAQPWPIYVNSKEKFLAYPIWIGGKDDESIVEEMKNTSQEFLLEPGDALCYSGTHHPHWRNQLQPDNFCDLIFFHFVAADFTGSLWPSN